MHLVRTRSCIHLTHCLFPSLIISDEEIKEETTCMPTKTVWTNEDESLLVHTLFKEQSKGNWGDNNPKKQAWVACKAALAGSENETKSCHKDIQTLKSRWQQVSALHDVNICVLKDIPSSNRYMILSKT
jgi:hypothetical protein